MHDDHGIVCDPIVTDATSQVSTKNLLPSSPLLQPLLSTHLVLDLLSLRAAVVIFALQSTLPDACLNGGSSRSTNSTSLENLPQEVLLQVLQQLPQQDRIGACSLTCKALHTAAGPATEEVQLSPKQLSQQQADALVAWLTKHSSRALSKFCLDSSERFGFTKAAVTLCLPWQQLDQLTSLILRSVTIQQADCCSSSSWSGLSQLSLLQRLVLEKLGMPEGSTFNASDYAASLGASWCS
jgi:hypothetical protein